MKRMMRASLLVLGIGLVPTAQTYAAELPSVVKEFPESISLYLKSLEDTLQNLTERLGVLQRSPNPSNQQLRSIEASVNKIKVLISTIEKARGSSRLVVNEIVAADAQLTKGEEKISIEGRSALPAADLLEIEEPAHSIRLK